MSAIILHHYPQSPVAEKVRVVLGLKSLDWQSVEIPRLPPKPDLMPLTGGYRRTPVMQIGADVYCDSQCIISELERRFPTPTLFPGNTAGIAWGLSRWIDGPLFTHAITVILGAAANLPEDFARDRGRLYFGPDFDLATVQSQVAHSVAQLRGQLGWFEQQLSMGAPFITGDHPGLVDALAYYVIWFIRGRWEGGPEFLSHFKALVEWEAKIRDQGHGHSAELDAGAALEIARNATSQYATHVEETGDFRAEDPVQVTPDGDGGDPVVSGMLIGLTADRIVIEREDDRVGKVAVHFPRVGYRLSK